MNYQFKMLPVHFNQIQSALHKGVSVEQACFLLCSTSTGLNRTSLLVREVIPLLPEDYDIQEQDRLSISPSKMASIADIAEKKSLSICFVHTHPGARQWVSFSRADDLGNTRSFRYFNLRLANAINSCLVFGDNLDIVCGRVYISKNEWLSIEKVSVIGGSPLNLKTCIENNAGEVHIQDTYDRQVRLLGKYGQRVVQGLRIVYVGAGGIGSIANVLLTHSGVTEIIGIDADTIEDTNRPRIIGAKPSDIGEPKVYVAARYTRDFNPNSNPQPIISTVEIMDVERLLLSADAIICCTDSVKSRAHLDQLCHQHYIPLLDLGVQFVASKETGKLLSEVGKVNLIMPGTACLTCIGDVSATLLEREVGPIEHRQMKERDGYIRGSDDKEPAMMIFNGEVTARGIQLLLGYFTGLLHYRDDAYEKFSFLNLQGCEHHRLIAKSKKPGCLNCDDTYSPHFGAGDAFAPLFRESG